MRRVWALIACACCAACAQDASRVDPGDDLRSAGVATVFDTTRDAFSLPMPVLAAPERTRFFVGNSFFNSNWVTAPASTADRDGLGPLFNARSCSTCHFKDGRGNGDTMLLRVSLNGNPHPVYGDQIQTLGNEGVAPEARVVVEYVEIEGRYADGEPYTLREPRPRLLEMGYGPAEEGLQLSARIAPALVGLGLLEAVAEPDILARVDPEDRDRDGISGRVNRVWDVEARALRLGRFGWKAEQPTIRQQTAAAFSGDMGITSSLFPDESCTSAQSECMEQASGGSPEIEADTLESVVRYVRTLGVPAQRAGITARGEALFRTAGCDACHVATLHTGTVPHVPELTHTVIHPYTDLLLHDLGDALSDRRPMFEASGREFRTAPLWGLGLVEKVNGQRALLHDGRARDLAEATLWHGGEAERSKRAFVAMPRADRQALLAFVESL